MRGAAGPGANSRSAGSSTTPPASATRRCRSPFFVLQPGMGAGIAASKTPDPTAARLKSVIGHTVFGLGLYAAAVVTAWMIP